jgi:hypothetical protein
LDAYYQSITVLKKRQKETALLKLASQIWEASFQQVCYAIKKIFLLNEYCINVANLLPELNFFCLESA